MMMTRSADPNLGRMLVNRYRLIELIGRGAMGRVYKAEDTLLGAVVAVKFLAKALLNPRMRDRFLAEARICAQLGQKSIHIVRVTDYGVNEDDEPFYVMEYLQGESLSDIIAHQVLPLPRFLNLARQTCLGLQSAHQGILLDGNLCPIIHRDIKPSNILVVEDPSLGEFVKILDFGIAKLLQSDENQTHSFMGTLAYSSPEQMEGRELDARSDIYSLGTMLYEMLTGKMPLRAETHNFGGWYNAHRFQPPRTFESVNPSLRIPKALEALVMSCLGKRPEERPQSVAEVLKALEPLEQRYSGNRQITTRIGEALLKKPPTPQAKTQPQTTGSSTIGRNAVWPADKPIAEIVFPQVLVVSGQRQATLWVMLSQQEIKNLQINKLYNRIYRNFLCAMSPHPMILWVTAIRNRFRPENAKTRWLSCYLDMHSSVGQQITRLIGETGQYQILLFAKDEPGLCQHTISVKVNASQCKQLLQWAITSQTHLSIDQPNTTKNLLKAELDRLKPTVEKSLDDDSSGGLFS